MLLRFVNQLVYALRFQKCAIFLILPVLLGANYLKAAPLIKLNSLADAKIELLGKFGENCAGCEIRVSYSPHFIYAYKPELWTPNRLVFKLKDFGLSTRVSISVKTATGISAPIRHDIKLKFENNSSKNDGLNRISKAHKDPFGGKGIDRFDVSSQKPFCNKQQAVFHSAKLLIKSNRFGDARIEHRPTQGCTSCSKLSIRWFHEPTGKIEYQIKIQKRLIDGICSTKERR
ncbi:MAG: hypothetical protein COA74_01965 [Gammaproteobacteria bacterium]|nr:MAG: hypothetical protein COA74_01965 [Gammaproteobacteria bacterium]